MNIDYSITIITLINFALLLIAIVIIYKIIYKWILELKNFIKRNNDMAKKIDIILNKLENKE